MVQIDNIQGFTKKLSFIQLLCTFPVKWNAKSNKYEKLPLKWFYFCSFTILTLSMTTAGAFIFVEKINYSGAKTALELSQVIVSLTIIFYFYFTKENLVFCLNSFCNIDQRMKILGATTNYRLVI